MKTINPVSHFFRNRTGTFTNLFRQFRETFQRHTSFRTGHPHTGNWFSAFGYTDIILKAGKVWDKVPFPLLIMPNANLSYTIQPESYSLMNAMEFMNDEYFSWDVTYFLNGWLFNRIPLLKKLKWREIVSCRGLYGHLSDKNNPDMTDGLFAFPRLRGCI